MTNKLFKSIFKRLCPVCVLLWAEGEGKITKLNLPILRKHVILVFFPISRLIPLSAVI